MSNVEKTTLKANIQLLRDAIVLFTATGAARGVSGHTGTPILPGKTRFSEHPFSGGAYATVPEVCIMLSLIDASEEFYPVLFDEAGIVN